MPRLWSETIEAHRKDVREAILESTAALVTELGLRAVTMSQIAERTGIGRATLYKYFPDVEAILVAWHHRIVSAHLERLTERRDGPGKASERLGAVLHEFALIQQEHRHDELSAQLHRGAHVAEGELRLHSLLLDLVTEAAEGGEIRRDIPPGELVAFCLHAVTAAKSMSSKAAGRRLVSVMLSGLRPTP